MKDAGYETHMIGKWHLGSYTHTLIPSQRGFDTYMGYLNDEEMYWTHQVSCRKRSYLYIKADALFGLSLIHI